MSNEGLCLCLYLSMVLECLFCLVSYIIRETLFIFKNKAHGWLFNSPIRSLRVQKKCPNYLILREDTGEERQGWNQSLVMAHVFVVLFCSVIFEIICDDRLNDGYTQQVNLTCLLECRTLELVTWSSHRTHPPAAPPSGPADLLNVSVL